MFNCHGNDYCEYQLVASKAHHVSLAVIVGPQEKLTTCVVRFLRVSVLLILFIATVSDLIHGCMILHDLFAEMVHQCSRLVGRWVIPQKSPNGSRVPNVPMAAAGSVHLEFVALAEPHLWLCQSQFGGS